MRCCELLSIAVCSWWPSGVFFCFAIKRTFVLSILSTAHLGFCSFDRLRISSIIDSTRLLPVPVPCHAHKLEKIRTTYPYVPRRADVPRLVHSWYFEMKRDVTKSFIII